MPRKRKSKLKRFLTKKKVGIIVLIMTTLCGLFYFRDSIYSPYPAIVKDYQIRYKLMDDPSYLVKLRNYCKYNLSDPIEGLDYVELLLWEHNHLEYPQKLDTNQNAYLDADRREMPIDILSQCIWTDGKALGRCGEFSLLYNGLLLANGYDSRIVVDCSVKTDNRTADDHVWNEVWIGYWFHIDPTEMRINAPWMYEVNWNKNINQIYGIQGNIITDLTNKYR